MGGGTETTQKMETMYCRALELRAEYLVENLDMELILPHLVTRQVVTFVEMEIIQAERARPHQVMKLLMMLPSKACQNFAELCEALEESEQGFIAKELWTALEEAKKLYCAPATHPNTLAALQASMETTLTHLGLGVPSNSLAAQMLEEESTTSQPGQTFDEPTEPVSYYFARAELQKSLQDQLVGQPCLVLSGVHGSGKTQLARYLSQWYKDNFSQGEANTLGNGSHPGTAGIRYEINCRSVENMSSGLEILAENLKLKPEADSSRNSEITTRQLLARILSSLSKFPAGNCSVLIFDDMKKSTAKVLNPAMIKKCTNVKLIITTNRSCLFKEYNVSIDGFGRKETLEFFQQDHPDCEETDEDIIHLGEKFSFLPLGLAASKMFMIQRSQTIEEYLEQLLSRETVDLVLDRESNVFEEDEYDKSLITALQMSLESIRDLIGSEAYKAFELVALLSPHQIPMQFVRTVLPGTLAEKLGKEGDITYAIQELSMCSILRNDRKENMMNIHSAVQLAILLSWSDEEESQNKEEAMFMMAGIVDKDTRTSDAYQSQWELVPHAQSVLDHSHGPFYSTKAQLAEIKLLEFLGHMYLQVSVPQAEEKLQLAKSRLFQYFVGKTEQEVNQEVKHGDENLVSASKAKAKYIYETLKKRPLTESTIVEFVLRKIYYEKSWFPTWLDKISISAKQKKELQSGCLTISHFEKFVQAGVALPLDVLSRVYIPEIFITNLYTFGRLYFYQASEDFTVPPDKADVYHGDLHVSFELSKLAVEELHSNGLKTYSILHWLLVQRFGLLYLLVEDREDRYSHSDIVSNALKAKDAYESLNDLNVDFFQHGFLKARADDAHNKAACMRQLIKCFRILLQFEQDKMKHLEYSTKATEFLIEVEKQLDMNSSVFRKLLNGTAYYIQLAQLLLLLGGQDNVNKAIAHLSKCCDEEQATMRIKYPWLQALVSLTSACIKKGSRQDLLMCEAKLQDYHTALTGTLKGAMDKRLIKVSSLLEDVKSFLSL